MSTIEFEEGREAYRDNISKEECPYAGCTDEYSAWLQGWEYEYYEWYHQQESDSWYEYLANCEPEED